MLELIDLKKTYVTKAGQTVACNGINLKFADKGLVFITGKSGCGKTTLLNLIGGLDNFDSGDIIIDGKKFSEFSPADYDSYRNTLVGFVFQEYNLLSEYTVEKNIRIATELQGSNISTQRVNELLEMVDLEGLNNRLPSQLSGGQKQRISIARALLKDAPILILDDSVSAVDTKTERTILDNLKRERVGKTTILIAHRISTVENMDKIILVEDGTVTAVGTHNELCSSCEEYAKMVKLQKLEDEGGDI